MIMYFHETPVSRTSLGTPSSRRSTDTPNSRRQDFQMLMDKVRTLVPGFDSVKKEAVSKND